MGCPLRSHDSAELAVGYVAGSLGADAQIQFERHMKRCPNCTALVKAQIALWDSLESCVPVEVSPDFDRRLFRRIAAEERAANRRSAPVWSWRPALPIAVASLALLLTLLMHGPAPAPNSPAQPHNTAIEQVEKALDDMEMLNSIGVAVIASPELSFEKM